MQRCNPRLNDEVGELSIRNHIAEVYWDELMKATSSKVRLTIWTAACHES